MRTRLSATKLVPGSSDLPRLRDQARLSSGIGPCGLAWGLRRDLESHARTAVYTWEEVVRFTSGQGPVNGSSF